MRALITGGAGFIGSHIAEQLLEQGHEVAALDNLSTGRRENVPRGVKLYEVDLRDRDGTLRAVLDFRPDAVSHQAAQASVVVSVREPKLDAEVNLVGGLNLLDACTAQGARVERVVFASTGGAIYGEVPEGKRAGEDTAPAPKSPYAIHKLAFEQLLAVYGTHRNLGGAVLRYANVYGPRQDPHGEAGVVAIFFDSVLSGRTLRINALRTTGDPGCIRDYVYVSDVARANVLALSGAIPYRAMNVGTGAATATRDLCDAIQKVAARRVEVEPCPPRPGDLERSVLDPSLCQTVLGKLVALDEGIGLTHAFFSAQRR